MDKYLCVGYVYTFVHMAGKLKKLNNFNDLDLLLTFLLTFNIIIDNYCEFKSFYTLPLVPVFFY